VIVLLYDMTNAACKEVGLIPKCRSVKSGKVLVVVDYLSVDISSLTGVLTCKEVETGRILHTLGYASLLGVVLPGSRRSYTSDLLEGPRIAWNENDRVTAWLLYELMSLQLKKSYPVISIPTLLSI
jgi:hypothetical protein